MTPLAALQGIVVFQKDIGETGAGATDLFVEDETTQSAQSLLGAELTQFLPVGLAAPLLLKLRAGWGHELADASRSFTAGFEGLPGRTFTVDGVNAPRDVAVIELLASLKVRQSVDLYLRYDGAFANDASTQGGSAGLRLVF